MRGADSSWRANSIASAAPDSRVHGTVSACIHGPVHWNTVTATAPAEPARNDWCRLGVRKASA